jgi:phosphatidylserine/phosphatidylglycerophosphate/cardiolipin synthase-like enzyme
MHRTLSKAATGLVFLLVVGRLVAAAETTCYFSPNGGAAHAIATQLLAAKKSVIIAAYAISEPEITAALLALHQKHILVWILVDKHQQSDMYSTAPRLHAAGLRVLVDRIEALHHNKYIVLDDSIIITGSMNLTHAGDAQNAENTLIIRDPDLAILFTRDWQKHNSHASTFVATHHDDYKPPILPPGRVPILKPRPRKESPQWHAYPAPSCPSTPPASSARPSSLPSGKAETTSANS